MFNLQANAVLNAYYAGVSYPVWLNNLVASYIPTGMGTNLIYDHLPEHYYGNLLKPPFTVFLSHNPGPTHPSQFISTANHAWFLSHEADYHNIASVPVRFPYAGTLRFIKLINNEIDNLCSNRLSDSENRLLIKDLLPFHSTEFGQIDFRINTADWIIYFLKPVLDLVNIQYLSTINYSTRYGKKGPKLIFFARGNCFNLMAPLGFTFVGRIASNLKVYKLTNSKLTYYTLVFTKAGLQYFPIKQLNNKNIGKKIFPSFNDLFNDENRQLYIYPANENSKNLEELLSIIEYLA